LLPGGSEAVLAGVLVAYPDLLWQALILATIGNTLGGMSSYLIGRFIPDEKTLLKKNANVSRYLDWVHKHGAPILLLSWTPVIGDALCVAAGWLRVNWFSAMIFMAVGKFARYWIVAAAANTVAATIG